MGLVDAEDEVVANLPHGRQRAGVAIHGDRPRPLLSTTRDGYEPGSWWC
jgi:hypothetical protein